jgi:SAM-dependent methyltransferase
MHLVSPRLQAAARYLSWADPPYKWKLARTVCPLCGPSLFISLKPSDPVRAAFLTRCLSCKANAVGLSLIPVIQERVSESDHAYELSTYGATLTYLNRRYGKVTTSEYMPDEERGKVVNGVLNQDVQRLTFPDNTFDLITSNAVMEHVPDDIQGFRESLRTLKPGGALIFSVPLYDTPLSIRMAELRDGRLHWLETPEYHDSRFGGPKSAPAFWRHSFHDIIDRVKAAGFKDVHLVDVMVTPSQGLPTKVVYAAKN